MKAIDKGKKIVKDHVVESQSIFDQTKEKLSALLRFSKPDLHDLFVSELQMLYWIEIKQSRWLKKITPEVTTTKLEALLEMHQTQTENQENRIKDVFLTIGEIPKLQECATINGSFKDARRSFKSTSLGTALRDVGVLNAVQKIKHHEIASYGILIALSQVLGHLPAFDLLQQSLKEEKEMDYSLTEIGQKFLNDVAMLE